MAKYGVFTSIDSPEKFSQTWESVVKVVGFLLSMFLSFKGVEAAAANQLVTDTGSAIALLGSAILASWEAKNAVFGAVRKLIVFLNKDSNPI